MSNREVAGKQIGIIEIQKIGNALLIKDFSIVVLDDENIKETEKYEKYKIR